MNIVRELTELLGQIARIFLFEGSKQGLRDREWMALRFLTNANRLSRTPSAVANYVGTTRGNASHIISELERLGYLEKTPSENDKRSVTLNVTPNGNKLLIDDPINVVADAIASLDDAGKTSLRDALRHVLDQSDAPRQGHHADICKRCVFLREGRKSNKSGASVEFTCRLFRKAIAKGETELLCTNFERPKR